MKIIFIFLIVLLGSFTLVLQSKYLKKGDLAPAFNVKDIFDRTVSIEELKGKKVLITFNRYVSCPLCNFRMHELLEKYDTLHAQGLIFISVYESGKENLLNYTNKEEVPFLMIADPEEKLYKLFNVRRSTWKTIKGAFNKNYKPVHSTGKKEFKNNYERDGHLNRIGADFLIDENGNIAKAYYGKYVGDHIDLEKVVSWVATNKID